MDPLDLISGTADAIYAADQDGHLVVWNQAAARLFGRSAQEVLGRPCHVVVCGEDIFGNRFCDTTCAIRNMVHRKEPVGTFQLRVATATGEKLRLRIAVVVLRGRETSEYIIIHLVQPANHAVDPNEFVQRLSFGPRLNVEPPAKEGPTAEQRISALTKREEEVLRLLAEGSSSNDIAERLFISVSTVRNHTQNILRKLCVHTKLEAAAVFVKSRFRPRSGPPD